MQTDLVRLVPHPTARNKASAVTPLTSGSIITSVPCLSTSLLPSMKGKRCDGCLQLPSEHISLRKCTGCGSFWYCGTTCQAREWKLHHKAICKLYNRYIASPEYQTLSPHDQVDAILLSQLLAQVPPDSDGAFATFLELLPGPPAFGGVPPICRKHISPDILDVAKNLYSRFGNNNFVLHSHLDAYAHGIFPLASRLFNHSCTPNSATKYIITPSEPVRMEVVALRDISADEEVTIPYLDPALPYETRQEALRMNYGFTCTCSLCTFSQRLGHVPRPPSRDSEELTSMEAELRRFVFGTTDGITRIRTESELFTDMPVGLHPLLHESYLPGVSELFSKASHEGPYQDALKIGSTLLVFPCLTSVVMWKLIRAIAIVMLAMLGMHALEMAKTAWNLIVSEDERGNESVTVAPNRRETIQQAKSHLDIASQILRNFGAEGDEDGPLEEIRLLQPLLDSY
ncbi:Histone-lysine N-methyltransferase ASHR1 [Grifola frondosa]|uniref:Histone-lysine N-methyltransferase ASHR1 n=1 Tax=Grifola frondosa TaxID=5627 RepID=A0A1C7M308_GRIFR|nr:Histone-lysine N-methyltransferase ASHR1 [Grifola frondosa]